MNMTTWNQTCLLNHFLLNKIRITELRCNFSSTFWFTLFDIFDLFAMFVYAYGLIRILTLRLLIFVVCSRLRLIKRQRSLNFCFKQHIYKYIFCVKSFQWNQICIKLLAMQSFVSSFALKKVWPSGQSGTWNRYQKYKKANTKIAINYLRPFESYIYCYWLCLKVQYYKTPMFYVYVSACNVWS